MVGGEAACVGVLVMATRLMVGGEALGVGHLVISTLLMNITNNTIVCWAALLHMKQYHCTLGSIAAYAIVLYCMLGSIAAYEAIPLYVGQH